MTKQLEELGVDFSDMSDEEIHEFIRDLRHRRSTPPPTAKKKQAKSSLTAMQRLQAMMVDMTPEQKAKFLEELEDE